MCRVISEQLAAGDGDSEETPIMSELIHNVTFPHLNLNNPTETISSLQLLDLIISVISRTSSEDKALVTSTFLGTDACASLIIFLHSAINRTDLHGNEYATIMELKDFANNTLTLVIELMRILDIRFKCESKRILLQWAIKY